MYAIKVHIVDDHQMMLDGLKALLSGEASIQIIGESNNGKIAFEKILVAQPDVLITDISMPEMNGLELNASGKRKISGN
jgi:two-component system nitrate/nitrite response regulator NarL